MGNGRERQGLGARGRGSVVGGRVDGGEVGDGGGGTAVVSGQWLVVS